MSILIKRSIRNKFLFWSGVLLIWAAIVAGTLWSKGYQPQSTRSFTDEQMIRIAVHRTMQRMQEKPPRVIRASSGGGQTKNIFFEPALIVPYKNVDHFLEENPKCCIVKKTDQVAIVNVGGKIFYRGLSGQIHFSETEVISWQYFPNNIRYLP